MVISRSKHLKQLKENDKSETIATQPFADDTKPTDSRIWTPDAYTALKLLATVRLIAAVFSNISDCDETYNYWEPMHFMMHGEGRRTWEYNPNYALRSYGFIWLHIIPLRFYTFFAQNNKILQFYVMRCLLAFFHSFCEMKFYRAIVNHFGSNAGRIFLAVSLCSAGQFISCAAFLPSAFCASTTMLAMAGWLSGNWATAVAGVAAGSIVAWPFAAVLGLPIAFDMVFRHRMYASFVTLSILSAVVFAVPMIVIDTFYYGKFVFAPWNIIKYNLFSENGPSLYGTEPFSFYFLNGFLNFNFIFGIALFSLPITFGITKILRMPDGPVPTWLALSPMYIWMLVFFNQPHKEERFLFPVYPLICMAGALTLDYLQAGYTTLVAVVSVAPSRPGVKGQQQRSSRRRRGHYSSSSNAILGVAGVTYFLINLSRVLALYFGYHAPLDVYNRISTIATDPKIHDFHTTGHINVCAGKEWYRFPSSFFMPEGWIFKLVKSDFDGMLPGSYNYSRRLPGDARITRYTPTYLNDKNQENYFTMTPEKYCHYIVDLDSPHRSKYEHRYAQLKDKFKTVIHAQFLNAQESKKLYRAFYVPFMSEKFTTYSRYSVFKNLNVKTPPSQHRSKRDD